MEKFVKAAILIGGPQKGTRFRPLSFDLAKPLFPVAGRPMVQHLLEACTQVKNLSEIFLIGFYHKDESLSTFIDEMSSLYKVKIRYLQEYTTLGTAGGIYHFRDQIRRGNPEAFFLINGDVCGEFDLTKMLEFHQDKKSVITVMVTETTRQESLSYGCIVEDKKFNEILHYVEKPSTFVSEIINCGVYICDLTVFEKIGDVYRRKINSNNEQLSGQMSNGYYNSYSGDSRRFSSGDKLESISLEEDILAPLAGQNLLYVYHMNKWWSQIKTASSAIYANRHYLSLFREKYPKLQSYLSGHGEQRINEPTIIGDVFIHSTAVVDPSATLGPNVSIGKNVKIGAGVRIKESIILGDSIINDHSLIMHSIIGWKSVIGSWTRIEGTPCDPNPNKPFAKIENHTLFSSEGKLNPSITVLGSNVQVPSEVIVLNTIVLPHKELGRSYKNEIVL